MRSEANDTGSLDVELSILEGIVNEWLQTEPKFAGQDEAAKLLAAAERMKVGLVRASSERFSEPSATASQVPLPVTRLATNTTAYTNDTMTLGTAREIVRKAQEEASRRNADRIRNPRLNHYYSTNTAPSAAKKRAMQADLLPINYTVALAAALVAEADVAAARGGQLPSAAREHGRAQERAPRPAFWMNEMRHEGQWPFGGDDNANYQVFRNVKEYGAVGDGKTDDTKAINRAMAEGNRCGPKCGSSSVKGAIIYFPAGTYLISSPLTAYYSTQIIGDPNNMPVLLAAPSFTGLGLISVDEYTGDDGGTGQWFINQNNFLRQVRNLYIDLTNAEMNDIAGIHWQVAQATSIQNVVFFGSKAADKSHMGIFAENGSGGFMADLTFSGGAIGIRCGNQQFTTRNFVFSNVRVAIDMLWDWGWTWKSLSINGADVGIQVANSQLGGSIAVLDSRMSNVGVGISVSSPGQGQEHFSISVDNLVMQDVSTAIRDTTVGTLLEGGSRTVASWTQGKVYDPGHSSGTYQAGGALSPSRPPIDGLLGGPHGGYFERSKPQYEDVGAGNMWNAKISAMGDGSTDDTIALQLSFSFAASLGRVLFIPAGSYIVTDTIHVPVGTRVVGECWSQIVAKGEAFSDMKNPRVMMEVGHAGDVGVMEIQDLMFTTVGATAGVVLMEWNVQQGNTGSAALWDSHFRVGGAKGTNLQASDCPKLTGSVNPRCIAASMLLHVTSGASGYFENMWAWVADHDLDSSLDQTQIDIYVARGVLIESKEPTWLYGTASEHCVLYQYELFEAENVFMGMIQTESPYFLPNPQAPAPFGDAVGLFSADPTFETCSDSSNPHCKAAWGLRIITSSNVHIFGAGLYNWFQAYTQQCVDSQDCQQSVVEIAASQSIWLYNLYTIGTVEMMNSHGTAPIKAKENTNLPAHPFTSIVNAWLLSPDRIDDDLSDEDYSSYQEEGPCDAEFATVDDVSAAASNIPAHCMNKYILAAEIRMLDKSLAAYTKTVDDGYDEKFAIYADQIKRLVPQQLLAAMRGAQASGFWECEETYTPLPCCSYCRSGQQCPEGCNLDHDCKPTLKATRKVDCPRYIPDIAGIKSYPHITYNLVDEDGFYDDLMNKYGIDRSWVVLGDYTVRVDPSCAYAGADVQACMKKKNTFWHNFAMAGTVKVVDPKTLIGQSFDNTKALSVSLSGMLPFTELDVIVDVGTVDLVDAASATVFLTQSAVESMAQVVHVADDALAAERQETIFFFLSAVLMLIPGVGSVLDAAAMTTLAAVIRTLGVYADIAFALYSVVTTPVDEGGIMAVFDLLMAAVGARSPRGFKMAAEKRRAMTRKEWDDVPLIKGRMDKIDDLRNVCVRK